ncbi:MAG: inositol monophosphatase [Candidatus Dadabacteria bacterium]|nr:inositol monophosphatase [Candidatus Dadabacteria bacterium]NIS09916.1 inositol monophosphatase [Candidatus Dadabacteria bacterium]NIY21681.1 inositol monophosphatase [Candidatus Dadabacteria bacterium]
MNYLDLAKKSALLAGDLLLKYLGKITSYELKSPKSVVTEADTRAEDLIIRTIKAACPDHGILAEESGDNINNAEYVWIIDPLDGTTNFAHAYPFFSVSIALEIEGVVKIGVIYDPVKKELFSAEQGRGAYLNDKPISVSRVDDLEISHLVTGFVYEHDWMVKKNLKHFEDFIYKSQAVRRDGSAALDLCYVACGRFDGFWEMGLNPWDTAAGALILREAGGVVTNFSGTEFTLDSVELLGSNKVLHEDMIKVLSSE